MDSRPRPLSSEARARVVLNSLTLPGDRLVGQAVRVMGAEEALARLWERGVPAQRILAHVLGVDLTDVSDFHRRYPICPTGEGAATVLEEVSRSGDRVLIEGDPSWPERLVDLGPFAPIVLFVRGNPGVMQSAATLGVVGSRHPSRDGVDACARVARDAIEVGYTLISGGAKGVDWVAHVTALNAQAPQVMVLATPLNRPASWQTAVLNRVADHGVVITEAVPGRRIEASHFLHRNRVIAALSDRVLVVEAAERSGSLNTASHARALGRDLSAMVWRARDEKNAGCYRLIDEWGADSYGSGARERSTEFPRIHRIAGD